MRILRARLLAAAAGGGRRRGQRRPPQPGPHRRPLRADPHLQLPREPDLRPPHRLQVLQPRPGARRRPRAGHRVLRRGRPRRPAGGPRAVSAVAASVARPRRPPGSRAAGVASPEHDAAELLAHVLGTDRVAAGRWSTTCPASRPAAFDELVGPPGGPRAAAAPDRHRVLPPRRAGGRPRGLRAAAGDRAAGRLGDRAARAPSCERARSWSTSAPGSGAIAKAVADEVPGARVHAVELDAGRARLGRAQPRRHRRRPAPRRHGDRVRRPRGHRRRRRLQPAVHPARGLGVGRARGARPRPAPRAVVRAPTGWTRSACSSARAAVLLRPGGVVGAEHADVAGRVGAGGVRRDRALDRRPRPPRSGRPSALHHGAAGTIEPVCNGYRPTTDEERESRRRRGQWRSSAASWSCCRPTPSTASPPTPSTRTPSPAARRPRAGAGRCRRRCWCSAATTLDALAVRRARLRPRAGRGVLAGPAHPGLPRSSRPCSGTSATPAAPSRSGCPTTRSPSSCSSAPGRWRSARPT